MVGPGHNPYTQEQAEKRQMKYTTQDMRNYAGEIDKISAIGGVRLAMKEAADEIDRLRKLLKLASDDLSLIVAKHAIGKDRTVARMAKYLNAEKR